MNTLAEDLRAARAAIVRVPSEAIMQAIAEECGLRWPDTDPGASFGYRSLWSYHPDAERYAGCLLYWLTPMTQREVARRIGYVSPGCKVPGARSPVNLRAYVDGCDDEGNDVGGYPLERIVARAEQLLRMPLLEDGVAILAL